MDFSERREITQPGRCASCLLSHSGNTTGVMTGGRRTGVMTGGRRTVEMAGTMFI